MKTIENIFKTIYLELLPKRKFAPIKKAKTIIKLCLNKEIILAKHRNYIVFIHG
jgi:hypothetical protein